MCSADLRMISVSRAARTAETERMTSNEGFIYLILAYRPQAFTSEANRMIFLFDLYEKYTADLFTKEKLLDDTVCHLGIWLVAVWLLIYINRSESASGSIYYGSD